MTALAGTTQHIHGNVHPVQKVLSKKVHRYHVSEVEPDVSHDCTCRNVAKEHAATGVGGRNGNTGGTECFQHTQAAHGQAE
jgi:hypothetical protein